MTKTARKSPANVSYDVAVGDTISIVLSSGLHGSSASLSLAYASSMCEVVAVREKAVQLSAKTKNDKTVTAWFPRKALVRMGQGHVLPGTNNTMHTTELARWFDLTGWTGQFLTITSEANVLSTR